MKVDMLYPEEEYVFTPMENFNEIDPNHGEDEFIITDFDTQITSEVSSTRGTHFALHIPFLSPRHMEYYIFRVFVPILLNHYCLLHHLLPHRITQAD